MQDCWRQAQEDVGKLAARIGSAANDAISLINPFSGTADCLSQGFTAVGAIVAGVELIPSGGKAVSLGARGLKRVLDRHTLGGIESAGKSLSNNASELGVLATDASAFAATASGRNIVRVVDAGNEIGVDRATGAATSTYTVITNRIGEVVTMHPGRPK